MCKWNKKRKTEYYMKTIKCLPILGGITHMIIYIVPLSFSWVISVSWFQIEVALKPVCSDGVDESVLIDFLNSRYELSGI